MKARKIVLLLVVLLIGGSIESAWTVRHHLYVGPLGCRVLGGKFYGRSFRFDEERRLPLPDGSRLEIVNAFGSVSVSEGEPGFLKVALEKVVFLEPEARARDFAQEIELRADQDGAALRIGTNREDLERRDGRVGFETRFRLQVPRGTTVLVRNRYGSVSVTDVAAADVENAHENVEVRRVAGPATVASSHGAVIVSEVAGSTTLRARHGDVELQDLSGPSELDVEHGDVKAQRTGALSLRLQHGDLLAEDLRGRLSLTGTHAGVEARRLEQGAELETSFRDVSVSEVVGDLSVRAQHAEVKARGVKGALTVETSFEHVELTGVEGVAQVEVDHGGVRAKELARGGRLIADGDDVEVHGFTGPLEVEARRGSVHLVATAPLREALTARANMGGVRLEVPEGSAFELDASARSGDVEARLPGLLLSESAEGRVAGRLGAGGARVVLSADHGSVEVVPHTDAVAKR